MVSVTVARAVDLRFQDGTAERHIRASSGVINATIVPESALRGTAAKPLEIHPVS
jgi:hypothetical protein